ncbi:MAG: hypothetical protein SGPRY_001896 [Prymnesium sp.]
MGGSIASTSNFFISFLLFQAGFELPFEEMIRPLELLIFISKCLGSKRRAKVEVTKERPNRPLVSSQPDQSPVELKGASETAPSDPPAQPPPCNPGYHQLWAKVMIGVTIGMCFANVDLLTTFAAIIYLFTCYLLFARSLLFSFTNQFESCGRIFWPSASAWVLRILFTAQLILVAVHSIKESYITAILVALASPLTILGHRFFTKRYLKQLDVLPLLHTVRANSSKNLVEPPAESPEERKAFETLYGPQLGEWNAVGLEKSEDPQRAKEITARFRALYVQQELEWPEFLNDTSSV